MRTKTSKIRTTILSLLLLTIFALIPGMSAKAETFGDFEYEVVDGNVRITKYTGTEPEVTVPETIADKKVTEIGTDAFYSNAVITKVVLPEGIERIEREAFAWCESLSQVSIPDFVTYIGSNAFDDTPWLKSQENGKKSVVVKNHLLWCECTNNGKVVVPEGVTYIPEAFFENKSFSTIVLPNSLKEIGDMAFYSCEKLSSIVIPSETTSIGCDAFSCESSMNFIFYPMNVDVFNSHLSPNTTEFLYSIADNKAVIFDIKYLGEKTEITVPAEISGYTVAFSDDVKAILGGITINHTHGGGKATCTEKAKCSYCGQEYFAHEYSAEWTTDGTNHWHECTVCGDKKDISAHTGGTATCTQLAVCSICDEEYGEFAHEYSNEWTTDGTNHWHECTACGDKKDISAHTLKTTTTKATLTTDGKIEAKCTACNKITKTTPIYAASNISLSKEAAAYTGKVQKPKAVVKDSKGNVIDAANYTLTLPSGLKKVGSYKVRVTLKGDFYEGSKTLTFKINPAKTKLSSVKAGSKSMTVKWTKKTTEVTGYEIRYSLKKDFKGAKSVIVKSAKSTSKEIKKLKAKKTYYVQIRTYKTVKGKKYYSDWSAAKKVKIKN